MKVIILQSQEIDSAAKDGGDFFAKALSEQGYHSKDIIKVDPAKPDDISFTDHGILIHSCNTRCKANEIAGVLWRVQMADTDKACALAEKFMALGIQVRENPQAALDARSKIRSAKIFQQHGITEVPETICLGSGEPSTNKITDEDIINGFNKLKSCDQDGKISIVLKKDRGSRGKQVHFPESAEQAIAIVREGNYTDIVLQKHILSDKSTLRANIVDGKIINVIRQFPKTEQRISNLGNIEYAELKAEQQALALRAAKAIGLKFTAIDLIVETPVKTGENTTDNKSAAKTYVLEANDTPAVHFLFTSLSKADKETIDHKWQHEVVNAVVKPLVDRLAQAQKEAAHGMHK